MAQDRPERPERAGFLVILLCGLLVVWNPIAFAREASLALPRLLSYGAPAIALLVYRLIVTGVGIAAGRALWQVRPGAPAFARAWLLLDAAGTVLTLATPYFPSNRVPGSKTPTLLALVAFNLAWWAYLRFSARVRRVWAEREDPATTVVEPDAPRSRS